jgi:hypothetical protein
MTTKSDQLGVSAMETVQETKRPWLASRENNGRFRTGLMTSLPSSVSMDVIDKISELRRAYLEAIEEVERLTTQQASPPVDGAR